MPFLLHGIFPSLLRFFYHFLLRATTRQVLFLSGLLEIHYRKLELMFTHLRHITKKALCWAGLCAETRANSLELKTLTSAILKKTFKCSNLRDRSEHIIFSTGTRTCISSYAPIVARLSFNKIYIEQGLLKELIGK